MNILDKIVLRKREEVDFAKANVSIKQLEAALHFNRVPYSFEDFYWTISAVASSQNLSAVLLQKALLMTK
jgi:hypothetical protein